MAHSNLVVASLLFALPACSSDPELETSLATQTSEVVDGRLAEAHTSTFAVRKAEFLHDRAMAPAEGQVICSAVAIAPLLLLTARHCVAFFESSVVACGHSPFGAVLPASYFTVSNELFLDASTRWYGVSEIVVPVDGDDSCGFDIAVLRLEDTKPVDVADIAEPNFESAVVAGDTLTAIGYGRAGTGDTSDARMERSGVEVTCVGNHCGSAVAHSEFMSGPGLCEGDSGGPALDSQGRVVGVLSRGSEGCGTPIYSSVLAWRDLIDAVAAQATARSDANEAPATPSCGMTPQRGNSASALLVAWLTVLVLRRQRCAIEPAFAQNW